jgi:hypothetical protein
MSLIIFVYFDLIAIFVEQSFYGGSIVLMIVTGNSVKVIGHSGAGHAAFYHAQCSEVKYDIASLEVTLFQVLGHSHDFVNFAVRFGVVG